MNNIPLIISEACVNNKELDYRFYIASVICSFHTGGNDLNYLEIDAKEIIEKKKYFLEKMKLSSKSFDRGFSKFLQSKLVFEENGNLNVFVKNKDLKKYVLINDKEVEKLLSLSSNEIKMYLVLKYQIHPRKKDKSILMLELKKILNLNPKTIVAALIKLKNNKLIDYEDDKCEVIIDKKIKKTKKIIISFLC